MLLNSPVCAQLYAKPVPAAPGSYRLDGFEFMPPPGTGWFEMKRDRHFVYFGKRLGSPTHSFIAIALSAPVEEPFESAERFRDHVARQLAESAGDLRSKIEIEAVALDTAMGPYCARYQTKTEDRGAANAAGRKLQVETVGLSCLHPNKKNLVIDLSYSERGVPLETGTVLREEGEIFLRSLRFLSQDKP